MRSINGVHRQTQLVSSPPSLVYQETDASFAKRLFLPVNDLKFMFILSSIILYRKLTNVNFQCFWSVLVDLWWNLPCFMLTIVLEVDWENMRIRGQRSHAIKGKWISTVGIRIGMMVSIYLAVLQLFIVVVAVQQDKHRVEWKSTAAFWCLFFTCLFFLSFFFFGGFSYSSILSIHFWIYFYLLELKSPLVINMFPSSLSHCFLSVRVIGRETENRVVAKKKKEKLIANSLVAQPVKLLCKYIR